MFYHLRHTSQKGTWLNFPPFCFTCYVMLVPGANQQIIPYRNSKITHIFRDVLHGQVRSLV
jgi:hypothetical protein